MPLEAITLQQARPLRKANAAKTAVVAVVVNTSGILYGSHEEEISVPSICREPHLQDGRCSDNVTTVLMGRCRGQHQPYRLQNGCVIKLTKLNFALRLVAAMALFLDGIAPS
jgi:hypothetical protein